jgi:hypothetical protein
VQYQYNVLKHYRQFSDLSAIPKCHAATNLCGGDGVLGVSGSVAPALGGEGLVVVGAEVHAELGPGVKVARGGDGAAAGALLLAVADVLPEGRGALDRGLVHLLVLPDVVGRAVAGDRAHLLALCGARTVARVLLDVVLDQRVGGPAVDGDQDGSALGAGGAVELDSTANMVSVHSLLSMVRSRSDVPSSALVPALADDEVTSAGEVHRVSIAGRVELNVAAGLVVLVVVLTLAQAGGGELEVGSIGLGVGSRGGEGASNG